MRDRAIIRGMFTDLHEIGAMFERLTGVVERFGGGFQSGARALYLPSKRERSTREAREQVARRNKRREHERDKNKRHALSAEARRDVIENGTPLHELRRRSAAK